MKITRNIFFIFITIILFLIILRNPVRTLLSFRKVPNTEMYCMDYYGSYNIDKVYKKGINIKNVERSLIEIYFPSFLASWIYEKFVANDPLQISSAGCSVVSFKNQNGEMWVGRNFEFDDNPYLLLNIKNRNSRSVALLDLTYLHLNREKLKDLSIINRCRLLFAPYIVEDGMNDKGLMVAEMCTGDTMMKTENNKPDIFESLLYRVILDYAGTVDEAIKIVEKFNVHFLYCNEHFMLADSSGNSAVIEFTDNNMKVIRSKEKWQVATNHILYRNTSEQNKALCPRYMFASNALDNVKGNIDLHLTTGLMEKISDQRTIWTSIYCLNKMKYFIYCNRDFSKPFEGQLLNN